MVTDNSNKQNCILPKLLFMRVHSVSIAAFNSCILAGFMR